MQRIKRKVTSTNARGMCFYMVELSDATVCAQNNFFLTTKFSPHPVEEKICKNQQIQCFQCHLDCPVCWDGPLVNHQYRQESPEKQGAESIHSDHHNKRCQLRVYSLVFLEHPKLWK